MKIIENELISLKKQLREMWAMVYQQMYHSKEALFSRDEQLAHMVIAREKRLNALELKIESECEDIIALYAPVAIDLRFVLAMFKMNTNLERMGDFAESIAQGIVHLPADKELSKEIMEVSRIEEMYKHIFSMFELIKEALDKELSDLALEVIKKDALVDEINRKSLAVMAEYIEQNPSMAYVGLVLMGIIRKLERFGDHCTNIAEEIIFYLEAKVVKHTGKIE